MPRTDVRTGNVRLDDIDYHQHNVRVNLGDLRELTSSIERFGLLQPVVLEQRGQRLRIRAGHRRVAAARLAGLTRIPAMVHADALDDDEWLIAAVHENTRRRGLDQQDRIRTITAMRAQGLTTAAIADAFGVSVSAVNAWCHEGDRPSAGRATLSGNAARGQDIAERVSREDVPDPATGERPHASVVAARLGVSDRTVVRHRTGTRPVSSTALRTFAQEARVRVEAGTWDTTDLLAAVERLAHTGRLTAALEHDLEQPA